MAKRKKNDPELELNDGDFEVEDDATDMPEEIIPLQTDHEWTDYVLNLLEKDEMYDGNPTCDGLRRIAEVLLGRISNHHTKVHQTTPEFASVTVALDFENFTTQGSADASPNNGDEPYVLYPLALAETRAEARALKRALRLRKVVTADEVSRKAAISTPVNDENRSDGGITDQQIAFIDMLSMRLDLSAGELITSVVDRKVPKLSELTHDEALDVISRLTMLQSDPDSDFRPEGTYVEDWQTTFGAK